MDAKDAMDVNLKEKGKIEELTMEWGSDIDDDPHTQRKEMQVLESLQPHRNLKKLTISFYGGRTFPSWIEILRTPFILTDGAFVSQRLQKLHPVSISWATVITQKLVH